MKKSEKITLIVFIIVGLALVITGLTIRTDYYSSLMFAMGFALALSSIVQFIRSYHNTRPQNIEKYREKVRQQSINLKDERKVQLRNRAGYLTWAATMILCLIAAFVAALFHADSLLIYILDGIAVLEYVVATIIYKYLSSKM